MSFIIAKKCENKIQISCDTKLTKIEFDYETTEPLSGILKIIILNPNVCIAFAGDVNAAKKVIEHIISEEIFEQRLLVDLLLDSHNVSNKQTDYLIAINSKNSHLIQIKDGKATEGLNSIYLGSNEAFEIFQGAYIPEVNKLSEINYKEIFRISDLAFDKACSASIDGVGDFHITGSNIDSNFNYLLKSLISIGPQKIHMAKANTWNKIPLGNNAIGSFHESYLTSDTYLKPAVGIHFSTGFIGVLLFPQISLNMIKIPDVTAKEFINQVEEKYHLKLSGLIVDVSTDARLNHNGLEALNCSNFEKAILCFTQAIDLNPNEGGFYFNRAQTYEKNLEYENAIKDYVKAISLNFKRELLYTQIGICHVKLAEKHRDVNEYRKAYFSFQKALEINPDFIHARNNLKNFNTQEARKMLNL